MSINLYATCGHCDSPDEVEGEICTNEICKKRVIDKNKIKWFITVISSDGRNRRCVGYANTRAEAINLVEANAGHISECYYKFCCIEGFKSGIFPNAIDEIWFGWINKKWKQFGILGGIGHDMKPEFLRGVVNWGIG